MLAQETSGQLDLLLGPLGLLAFLLLVVVWGGRKRWWVFGWIYDQKVKECAEREAVLIKERDEWKELAKVGTRGSESAVRIAEKVVTGSAEERA